MSDQDNSGNSGMGSVKKVREVSLTELTGRVTGARPDLKPHRRRRIEADDPYFSVLDSGREFLVWFRKHKNLKKEMSGELTAVLLQLEKLLRKVQLSAIEDEFDYSANYNDCYYEMANIFNILGNFRSKLNVFMRNEKAVMAAMGMNEKSFSSFKAQIKKLNSICDRLEKNIKMFAESLEKEYGIESVLPKEKIRVAERKDGDY